MTAGGKRFRPMLALLAAQLGDPTPPEVIRAAVVCELTHLATLYHDDVMDEAPCAAAPPAPTPVEQQRRHPDRRPPLRPGVGPARRPRSRGRAGPGTDLRAAGHRPDAGDRRRRARRGPDGPLPRRAGRQDRLAGRHLGPFRRDFAGVEPAGEALTAFGEEFGVAFQLSDDLIDIVSEGGTSGKSPGTDLREGIATLPVLFALAGDDPAEARLRELVAGPIVDDAEHAEALALLRPSHSLARATAVLGDYADRARARLDAVPDGPVRDALAALCAYVVTRTS